jgi:hypothetical protein
MKKLPGMNRIEKGVLTCNQYYFVAVIVY